MPKVTMVVTDDCSAQAEELRVAWGLDSKAAVVNRAVAYMHGQLAFSKANAKGVGPQIVQASIEEKPVV